jgi:Rrf2 family cysteine metabolism transcriptional repressor
MRVSQRLDYTLRGLIALAGEPQGAPVVAGEIADRLGLPRRFLEQQFTAIAKRGLLSCQRGANGGCSLARPPSEITVGEIVRAVQGQVLDVPHVTGAASSEMWTRVSTALAAAVDDVTLADLADRQAQIDQGVVPMYYI